MKNIKEILRKGKLTFILVIAMAAAYIPADLMLNTFEADAAATPYAPRAAADRTIWDCVYFGSYPQTEIVDKASTSGCYSKDWEEAGDYDVDPSLYLQLQNAAYDANGDTTINGIKYKRLSKDDVTYRESYNGGYFNWDSSKAYKYFRYEKIKWRVLEKKNGYAMLLADKALDDQKYNLEGTLITWEGSTMRSWLNGYDDSFNNCGIDYSQKNFMDTAFASQEQNAIQAVTIDNIDSIEYGTAGGNPTSDQIFLLSESDVWATDKAVSHGFIKSRDEYAKQRRSKSTSFAKAMGTWSDYEEGYGYYGTCYWGLRSPGYYPNNTACIYNYGSVDTYGCDVECEDNGVRPALYINLSSPDWTSAGNVSSDGRIDVQDISNKTATISSNSYTYNGRAKVPVVTISGLTKGTDFKVSYSNNVNAGRGKVTITGIGNFFGSQTKTFTIKRASISGKTATIAKSAYTFNGKLKKPTGTISGLTSGSDYRVTYARNRYVGKAAVKFTGIGNYTGTIIKNFKINPKGTTILDLTRGKKSFGIKWRKQLTDIISSGSPTRNKISGYQIRYSTSKKMTNAKSVKVAGYSSYKTTIKNLKASTTYYVQVRTYKRLDGVNYYSSWCGCKYIKTK